MPVLLHLVNYLSERHDDCSGCLPGFAGTLAPRGFPRLENGKSFKPTLALEGTTAEPTEDESSNRLV